MIRSVVGLCLSLWASVTFAHEGLLSSCLSNYVYASRGYLYLHSGLALKSLDSKFQTYILASRESCQRLGLSDGHVQVADDRRVKFLKLSGGFSEGAIIQSLKPTIQLAVHAQIARSFDETARHAIEISKFPRLIFTYQVNFRKNLYTESISYGQKWELESD